MKEIPMEWVDNLFICMSQFYGDRWSKYLKGIPEDIHKAQWKSSLVGLSYDDIRSALVFLKQAAKFNGALPPTHLEFFRYAKKKQTPFIRYETKKTNCSPEVAQRALNEINSVLKYKNCSI